MAQAAPSMEFEMAAMALPTNTTVGFEAEFHTGDLVFSIHNTSDPGVLISTVYMRLGTNMLFDTVSGGAAFNPLDKTLQEAVGYQNTHFINGRLGSPYTCLAGTAVGYTGLLSTDIVDGGTNATFHFTDFSRGEAWGFYVDWDTRSANTNPAGSAMNYALLTVTFTDLQGNFLTDLSYAYGTFGGTKRSFPTEMGNLDGPTLQIIIVPEPSTALLLSTGYLWLAGFRRKRKPPCLSAG